MRKLVITVALVGLVAPVVLADDLNPPPWERITTPNTTYQHWDSWFDWYVTGEYLPDDEYNPYYEFGVEDGPLVVDPYGFGEVLDEYEGRPDVLHLTDGDWLEIMLPNTDTPNPQKDIYFQWVWHWDGAPSYPEIYDLFGTIDNWELEVLESYPFGETEGWWYEWFKITIYPNVDFEEIDIWPAMGGGDLYIDQIVIDTRCVPEPATLGLFVIGALALLRRKR